MEPQREIHSARASAGDDEDAPKQTDGVSASEMEMDRRRA